MKQWNQLVGHSTKVYHGLFWTALHMKWLGLQWQCRGSSCQGHHFRMGEHSRQEGRSILFKHRCSTLTSLLRTSNVSRTQVQWVWPEAATKPDYPVAFFCREVTCKHHPNTHASGWKLTLQLWPSWMGLRAVISVTPESIAALQTRKEALFQRIMHHQHSHDPKALAKSCNMPPTGCFSTKWGRHWNWQALPYNTARSILFEK